MSRSTKKQHDVNCSFCGKEHDMKEISRLLTNCSKTNVSVNCEECGLKTNFRFTKLRYIRAYHSVHVPQYYASVLHRNSHRTAMQTMLIKEAYNKLYHKEEI